jgi:hypothetical protein
MLLQIDIPYACGGIEVDYTGTGKHPNEGLSDAIITDAAPIFKWMIGKTLSSIVLWVNSKGGKVTGLFEANPKHWHGVWGTNG